MPLEFKWQMFSSSPISKLFCGLQFHVFSVHSECGFVMNMRTHKIYGNEFSDQDSLWLAFSILDKVCLVEKCDSYLNTLQIGGEIKWKAKKASYECHLLLRTNSCENEDNDFLFETAKNDEDKKRKRQNELLATKGVITSLTKVSS